MPYLPNGMGQSPFLTASFNHFHSNNFPSSNHPHYNTNSYTNSASYLASYASPKGHYQQKYFPKDMINVLPGVSHLSTEQEQKLLNPLNTYSGDAFKIQKKSSPFERGQIYYGKRNPNNSPVSETSVSTIMDQLQSSSYTGKKDNPFHKKYLLSQKNRQLENYALYSSISSSTFQLSQYAKNKRKTQKSERGSPPNKTNYQNQEEIASNILKMATRYKQEDERGQQKSKTQYSTQRIKTYQRQNEQTNKYKYTVNSQRQHEYLVQSQVDEKQFGSFGQGNEYSNENLRIDKVDQGESLIVGLAKVTSDKEDKYKVQQKSRRQPVFIESDDELRKSGSFKVPQAIIDEINNPRIPSTIFKRGKESSPAGISDKLRSNQMSEKSDKQRLKYSKEQAVQVGRDQQSKIPRGIPNTLIMRGKVYEKIL